jgi:hypothetical protein
MPGWGGSPVRSNLQVNSLQTGNFTGNFGIYARSLRFSVAQAAVPPMRTGKFPKQPNRELESRYKEFKTTIRDLFVALRWPAALRHERPSGHQQAFGSDM